MREDTGWNAQYEKDKRRMRLEKDKAKRDKKEKKWDKIERDEDD